MRLIGTIRECWAFWSVRFATLQQATIVIWMTCVPSDLKTPLLYHAFECVVGFEGALILLARVIKQQPINADGIQQLPEKKP